jgi:hypothetical protein
MAPVSRITRLLLAVLAVPVLTGCAALGLPELPGSPLVPFGAALTDTSPAPGASADPAASAGSIASADGYTLSIPSGWAATDLSLEDGMALADAVAVFEPTLGSLGRAAMGLDGSPSLSMAAVDLAAASGGGYAPGVVVATLRTRGMDKGAARNMVEDLLAQAPLAADVSHTVEGLPAGDAHRYDAIVESESGTLLHFRIDVFRVGGVSFVVAAVAPDDQFAGSEPMFDAILKSLRFGV